MIIKTRIFDIRNTNYKNLPMLAKAMGVSESQIYMVRKGKCDINQEFIIGAIKAFPNYTLNDLFYLASAKQRNIGVSRH